MKAIYLLTLILNYLCISIKAFVSNKMVTSNVIAYNNKYYQIEFSIGTNNEIKSLKINQDIDFLSFYYMLYNPFLSKSVETLEKNVDYDIYEDTLTLITKNPNISLFHFPFKIASDYTSRVTQDFKGSIGLSYKIRNMSYSLVHRLHSMGFIDHLSYSLIPNSNYSPEPKPYQVVFGGIPPENIEEKNRGICHVDQSQSHWSCQLSKIIIGNYYIYNNDYNNIVSFQAGERYIIAPMDFINYLTNTVFKKPLETHRCFNTNDYIIYCEIDVIKHIPSISFVIEKMVYTLEPKDLFDSFDDYNRFAIYPERSTNNEVNNNNSWKFGLMFLIQFPALFDYENSVVELYSDTKIQNEDMFMRSMNNNKLGSIKYSIPCIIINIIVLLIGVVNLVYSNYNRKV